MTSVFFRRQYEVLPGYYRPDTETSKTDNRKRLQIKKRFSKTQAIKEGFMLSALVPQKLLPGFQQRYPFVLHSPLA
jgi:hypothetical protein